MANLVVWADLPVKDLTRACKFYSKLLGYEIKPFPGMETKMALLMRPDDPDQMAAGVDLSVESITQPSSTHGACIYLSAGGDIDGMLGRCVEAGGTVHAPKQNFGELGGWLAWIIDTEGNIVGLQQPLDV